MILSMLLDCAAAAATTERFTGTLEPRWWPTRPGFGENESDGIFVAIVLRLDTPRDGREYVQYSAAGADKLVADTDAAACLGGRVTVEAAFVPGDSAWAGGTLTGARVLSCSPPARREPTYGEAVTLTGILRRWWWFVAPGYGAEPLTDKVFYGVVLLVDGSPVPIFPTPGSDSEFDRHRRFSAACDGQEVTVTGRWEPAKNSKVSLPYKLMDVSYAKPCSSPRFFRGLGIPPKPAPAGWLD